MRKLYKLEKANKMSVQGQYSGAVTSRLSSGEVAQNRVTLPPSPTPALDLILSRLKDANDNMNVKLDILRHMNDRFFGAQPETGSVEKEDSDIGALLSQVEHQVLVYEQLIAAFGGALERLNCI